MGPRAASQVHTGTAGKLERIRQLDRRGLNTPRLILVEAGTCFDDELLARLRDAAAGDDLMTVRTYHPTDETRFAKGPFAPEIPVEEAVRLAEAFSREWNVLFQEAIDVEETVLAGNLLISASGAGSYEALAGRYRVRDVEAPPPEEREALRRASFEDPFQIEDTALRELAEDVLASRLLDEVTSESDEQVVIEFNVQERPVGRLSQPILLWEWRPLHVRRRAIRRSSPNSPRQDLNGAVFGLGLDDFPMPPPDSGAGALGGKGAALTKAARAGLTVPPAALLSVLPGVGPGTIPRAWTEALSRLVPSLQRASEQFLGADRPFSLAVRSSPTVSMPGMLETVIDVQPETQDVADAIVYVLESWRSERAASYRHDHGIDGQAGLALVVQPVVLTSRGAPSGSGVGFTRDPRSGSRQPVIEYLDGEPGDELVGGTKTPLDLAEFRSRWPGLSDDVFGWIATLESVFEDVVEFEFAVESSRPFLLQARSAMRTAAARLRFAHDLVEEGVILIPRARELLGDLDLARLERRRLHRQREEPLASALTAAPGVAVGRLALTRPAIEKIRTQGDPVIFVAPTADPEDYPVMKHLRGLLTKEGGITSHASVAAMDAGITALVGCRDLGFQNAPHAVTIGQAVLCEGDWLSLEGAEAGLVFGGRLVEEAADPVPGLTAEMVDWARSVRTGPAE